MPQPLYTTRYYISNINPANLNVAPLADDGSFDSPWDGSFADEYTSEYREYVDQSGSNLAGKLLAASSIQEETPGTWVLQIMVSCSEYPEANPLVWRGTRANSPTGNYSRDTNSGCTDQTSVISIDT